MRSSGILLHITSLPSKYGIGDLGPGAHAWLDFMQSAKMKNWQILPINPTDGINGYSPYSCFSAFAGNPLFISPQGLVEQGYLMAADLKGAPSFDNACVDYPKVMAWKEKIFSAAFARFAKQRTSSTYDAFYHHHKKWLDDYAVFIVAKAVYGGRSWIDWPSDLRKRRPAALAAFVRTNAKAIAQAKFIQYAFFTQWSELKAHAHKRGVSIIGDIPIYVNHDSVEVWCHPSLFKLDAKGHSKFVSGCPPDYFSKTGQRWGNPVYDWAALKKQKFSWWLERISHNLDMFDYLRIDHFRGFASFWQIPAHEKFAVFGRWVNAPGKHFLKAVQDKFKHVPLIAEDLGEINDEVLDLMRHFHLPGMRVLLFGFGGDPKKNPHAPANYINRCVAYTGTHDNNTVQGWLHTEATPHEKANIAKVLGLKKFQTRDAHWTMIKALLASKADMVIVPMPDILGLRETARMNTPATKVNNWKWRVDGGKLTKQLAGKLSTLTKGSKRV